jgi:hypothetical protein
MVMALGLALPEMTAGLCEVDSMGSFVWSAALLFFKVKQN